MHPRVARVLLLLFLLGSGGTLAWVAPRWVAARPTAEGILALVREREFAAAAKTVAQFLDVDGESPTARILFAFDPGPRAKAADVKPGSVKLDAGSVEVLSPRGRVFGTIEPRLSAPPLDPLDKGSIELVFEIEGKGLASTEMSVDARCQWRAACPPTHLGRPGAAGRVRVVKRESKGLTVPPTELAGFAFEIVHTKLQEDLESRLQVVARIAGADAAAERYLRAMCFAREGCFSNALVELDALLLISPESGALTAARADCAARAAAFPALTRG